MTSEQIAERVNLLHAYAAGSLNAGWGALTWDGFLEFLGEHDTELQESAVADAAWLRPRAVMWQAGRNILLSPDMLAMLAPLTPRMRAWAIVRRAWVRWIYTGWQDYEATDVAELETLVIAALRDPAQGRGLQALGWTPEAAEQLVSDLTHAGIGRLVDACVQELEQQAWHYAEEAV